MRQLLIITLTALMLSCSEPAPFRGSVRELVPEQVGDFKLKGEIKSLAIAPLDKYQSGAIRPTEGVIAQYEVPGRSQLTLQVVNYPSPSDASQGLKQMEGNVRNLASGAKLTEVPGANGKQRGARRIVVEEITPGFHTVIWVNGSVFYQVSGDDLKAILEFEQSLP